MRFQIDLDEQGEQMLSELERRTGVRTHRELFNNAITLLDWAVEQCMHGRQVASLDAESKQFRELQMPVLKYAASLAEAERHAAEKAVVHAQNAAAAVAGEALSAGVGKG